MGNKYKVGDLHHWSKGPPYVEHWVEVEAFDSRMAAKIYAEGQDPHCDMGFVEFGGEVIVLAPDGTYTRWNVRGEMEPTYYAYDADLPKVFVDEVHEIEVARTKWHSLG